MTVQDAAGTATAIAAMPAPEAAEALSQMNEEERAEVFRALPFDVALQVFTYLDVSQQRPLLAFMADDYARRLLERMEPDDRTRLLEHLPEEESQKLLALLGVESRREASELLSYPPDSVGRLMSTKYVAVRPHWTTGRVLEYIHSGAFPVERVGTVFVTTDDLRLVDMLDLAYFVVAEPGTTVEQIMDRSFASLCPEDDREMAVQAMLKHDVSTLPVVDHDNRLVGVVNFDDVMDVAEEEATEDIQKQAGVAPLKASYPNIGILPLFGARIPWLAALIFVYLGASGVISAFEDALAAEIVLAAFIPLLMGSGGNVGAQSGTLTVRAIATGGLGGAMWMKAFRKEIAVGVLLGLVLAVLAGIVGQFRGGSDVAVVIALSMLLIVISANVFGILLPLLLAKIGVDPAVASSPVITSMTDLSSLFIYLGIASYLLGI